MLSGLIAGGGRGLIFRCEQRLVVALEIIDDGWPFATLLQETELRVVSEAVVNPLARRREGEVSQLLQGREQEGTVFHVHRHQQRCAAFKRGSRGIRKFNDLRFQFWLVFVIAKPFIYVGTSFFDGERIVFGGGFMLRQVGDGDRRLVEGFIISDEKKRHGGR